MPTSSPVVKNCNCRGLMTRGYWILSNGLVFILEKDVDGMRATS